LYNILIEIGIRMTLVKLIKMCLSETYSRVSVGKHMYDMLHIKSDMNSTLYHHCFSTLLYNMP
jgi:hypothetical protein